MLSKIPIDLSKVKEENLDNQIIRIGLVAELDAINLYEQMAELTENLHIKTVLLDIANEEKEHVGEFQYLLLKYDEQQIGALEKGKKEVQELMEK